MARCRTDDHAQLPKTYVHVFLVYCHQCQAFQLMESMGHQYTNDLVEHEQRRTLSFGPFDTPEDVFLEAQDSLHRLVMTAGRPWDHQHPPGEMLLTDEERGPLL